MGLLPRTAAPRGVSTGHGGGCCLGSGRVRQQGVGAGASGGVRAVPRVNAEHGKTYYLATLLLPPAKRPYVHALYGFARYADEIVDGPERDDAERPAEALGRPVPRRPRRAGDSDDPVSRAVIDTVQRWDIPLEHFEAFLDVDGDGPHRHRATRPTTTSSATSTARPRSSALQMVPILEPLDPAAYGRGQGPRASRSSWPTSSATSARTSTAAGSTCRWRTSSASA